MRDSLKGFEVELGLLFQSAINEPADLEVLLNRLFDPLAATAFASDSTINVSSRACWASSIQ